MTPSRQAPRPAPGARPRRATGLALGLWALLLAGCGSIAAYESELATWQALADRATARVGQPRVIVKPSAGTTGRYDCRDNRVIFGTDGNARWLLAHELGHYVMHHCEPQPWEVALQQEKAANRFAVETLQLWGATEDEAVRESVQQLLLTRRLRPRPQRGHDYCAEALDLLRRYPRVADPRPPNDSTCAAEFSRK